MKAVFAILLPVAFLLLLHSPPGSAEETLDASSNLPQQTSGDTAELDSTSRAKRGRHFNLKMLRYSRGLHMLRLGKRADDLATTEDSALPTPPPLPASPETLADMENLLGQYYYYKDAYPGYYNLEEDVNDGDNNNNNVDGELEDEDNGELYYPEDENLLGDEESDDDFQQPGDRYRRSESDLPPEELSNLDFAKRQDEQNNDEFTGENKRGMSMLRLGKRQMSMLRLGKRQMSMLRLGKRPMSMLRLGKRPMSMLRLGKRPMNMLRLGKRPMNMLRLGKRPMSMLRLGKRPMNMLRLGKRPMNMLRLGKRPMSMLRLGKRPMNMLRLGKRPMSMLRLGKRPMSMLRLGKRPMSMLRLGKRSAQETAEDSVSA